MGGSSGVLRPCRGCADLTCQYSGLSDIERDRLPVISKPNADTIRAIANVDIVASIEHAIINVTLWQVSKTMHLEYNL